MALVYKNQGLFQKGIYNSTSQSFSAMTISRADLFAAAAAATETGEGFFSNLLDGGNPGYLAYLHLRPPPSP